MPSIQHKQSPGDDGGNETIVFAFADAQDFQETYEVSLKQGILFAQLEEALTPFSRVSLCLELPTSEQLELEGDVVQVMEMGTSHGVTFQLATTTAQAQTLEEIAHCLSQGLSSLTHLDGVESIEDSEDFEDLDEELQGGADGEEEEDEEEEGLGLEEVQARTTSLMHKIKQMGTQERIRYAARTMSKTARAILSRDNNPQVLKFLLRNPRSGLEDVQKLLRNNRLTGDAISMIAKDKRWNNSEEIRMQIVRHPKTPTPLAARLMPFLQVSNLRILAKSNSVREAIKRQAITQLARKGQKP